MGEKDKDRNRALPWVFTATPAAETAQAGVDPATALYRLHANTRNPFLRRALAPSVRPGPGSATDVQRLFRLLVEQRRYAAGPENVGDPFRRRELEHVRTGPPERPRFQQPAALPGNPVRLPALIAGFFRAVLERLRARPDGFFDVVDDVRELLEDNGVRVRIPEAFMEFEDWEHLMETLEEISRYPAPETFDLFCGALLAYDALVDGEDG